jgi:hypothetical protein
MPSSEQVPAVSRQSWGKPHIINNLEILKNLIFFASVNSTSPETQRFQNPGFDVLLQNAVGLHLSIVDTRQHP